MSGRPLPDARLPPALRFAFDALLGPAGSPHRVKAMRSPSGDQEGLSPSVSFRGWPLAVVDSYRPLAVLGAVDELAEGRRSRSGRGRRRRRLGERGCGGHRGQGLQRGGSRLSDPVGGCGQRQGHQQCWNYRACQLHLPPATRARCCEHEGGSVAVAKSAAAIVRPAARSSKHPKR